MDSRLKWALAVCGVAALLWVAGAGRDKPVPGTCTMTVVGVGLLAEAALKAQSASGAAISSVVSGFVTKEACEAFVKKLEDNPSQPQPVKVQTPEGQVVENEVTRDELARQAQLDEQAYLQRQAEMQRQAQLQYQAQLHQQAQLDYEAEVAAREALDRIRREIQCLISYQDSAILYQWCVDRSIEPLVQQQTEPLIQQH